MADTNRIAKNTMYMYIRMILVMAIVIYTSRVVLDKLGIDDYGLYNAVTSIVTMMIFLNQTLSTSTSRFLTYDLGKGNYEKLKATFSTAFFSHLILAGIIVLVMETIGLWYLGNKFVVPHGRENAVQIVFQISLLITAVSVCQVPFTATIMAHENMGVYAWVGIFEVVAKLLIVYLLSISPIDRLIFYSFLTALTQLLVTGIYVITCLRNYNETKFSLSFDKQTFHGMIGFTGWTALANLANTMIVQGAVVLMNLFFAPAFIAARSVADQVSHAIMGFVNNFRVAMNPQIIKTYAAGNQEESKKLVLNSMTLSFYLLLLLGTPFIAVMDTVLNLWLVEVPPYCVAFTQLAIFSQIINTLSTSTYVPFVAAGKLKLNALWGVVTGLGFFIFLYLAYKMGGGVLWSQYMFLIVVLVSVFILRPYLLSKELNYSIKELFLHYWYSFRVMAVSSLLVYVLYNSLEKTLMYQSVLFVSSFFITGSCIFIFMEGAMRIYLIRYIKNIIKRK